MAPKKTEGIPPGGAAGFVPDEPSLDALRAAVPGCRGCPLFAQAIQAVFGEGPEDADMVLVGEGPGDVEDRTGRPFVGPAGQVFDDALRDVGLDRSTLYVTNAVKHFKWQARPGRRLVQKPSPAEVRACHPWLEAELQLIRPQVLVCLGAVATASLLGPDLRVTRDRGRLFPSPWAPATLVTVHPSAVLRMPDEDLRRAAYRSLVDDLRIAKAALGLAPSRGVRGAAAEGVGAQAAERRRPSRR